MSAHASSLVDRALIPAPRSIRPGVGDLAVPDEIAIDAEPTLVELARRTLGRGNSRGGRPIVEAPAGRAPWLRLRTTADASPDSATTGIRADGVAIDESSRIEIGSASVLIEAATAEGVFRALTTLRQLLDDAATIPCGVIIDSPRFAWRGLSLDVVRCFQPPDVVRRVLDICADLKVNVLHLHLTDDEGWRLPVPGWPRLVEAAVPSDPRTVGSYSAEDLAALDAYAADRFVTIVPEIDMPAHSAAAIRAYPELGEGSILRSDLPVVERFVEDVLAAAAAAFPRSAVIHVGGDEAFSMSDAEHAAFVSRAARAVRDLGRHPAGWQECARAEFGDGDLVQYWMDPSELEHPEPLIASVGPERAAAMLSTFRAAYAKAETDAARAVAAGASIIASPSAFAYLDRPFAADSEDAAQDRDRLGLRAYPDTPILDTVRWEPTRIAGGVPESAVAGVEAAVWGETVHDAADLEALLLPRLAGVAERAWVPRGEIDPGRFLERVATRGAAWDAAGWRWYRSTEVGAARRPETGDATPSLP